MTDNDLAEMIALGHESRRVEFKGPGRRDDGHTMAVVARAVLAMANVRGGGSVIIGVAERADKTLDPLGVSPEVEATWLDFDALCDQIARFAEPSVTFEVAVSTFKSKRFVVIEVQEFADVPIICRQSHSSAADPARGRPGPVEVLRAGALYVRGRRKPESVAVRNSEDMREVIELAIEKGIARYERLSRIAREAAVERSDTTLYDDELGPLK
jgi:predicted HTH transcriptional regulator